MNPYNKVKRTLTAEKVLKNYQKRGVEITLENAQKVVDILYFLAKLVVEHHLKA